MNYLKKKKKKPSWKEDYLRHADENFLFQMLSAICSEILDSLSHSSRNYDCSRSILCRKTHVTVQQRYELRDSRCWRQICGAHLHGIGTVVCAAEEECFLGATLLESSVYVSPSLSRPPWSIREWLFLCSQSLRCDLKLLPHILDSMDAPSLLSRQYGDAAVGKKGFPQALLLSAFTSLPPSLPPPFGDTPLENSH